VLDSAVLSNLFDSKKCLFSGFNSD
jgi:hypothetical protein